MKKIIILFCMLVCLRPVYAQNLCGVSCDFTIDFSDGGSLVAVESLTFTFGVGGTLDLGVAGTINTSVQPASTDFSSGGTLVLAAGESISFGAGGYLSLGDGGNLDSTTISIDTVGDINVTGYNSLTTPNITLTGGGSLTLIADDIVVSGMLNIEDGNLVLNAYGGIVDMTGVFEDSCYSISEGSITVSIASEPVTTLSAEVCDYTPIQIFDYKPGSVITLEPEVLSIGDLQMLSDLSQLDGLTLTIQDGLSCTVSGEQCTTDDGVVYELVDGQLVLVDSAAGAFNIFWLFFCYTLLYLSRPVRRFA